MTERIGVAGLGLMGFGLAERLAGQGASVGGWTRSGVDPDRARAAGFQPHASLEALVESSDIVLTSLFDETAVRDVLGQLSDMDLSGKLIADTSTVPPAVPRELGQLIEAAGGRLIDAPISGGPDMIAAGTIGLFVGGSDVDFARFEPVLAMLSNRSAHVGDLGAGTAMKIVNNVALAGALLAAGEALELAEGLGLDFNTTLGVLAASPATAPAFKTRVDKISGADKSVGFAMSTVVKDAALFYETGLSVGLDLLTAKGHLSLAQATEAAGLSDHDVAAMFRYRLGLD